MKLATIIETKKDLPFNLASLLTTRLLIQSNSGGGKSYAIRRLLEVTHGKVQHIVLDMEGEFSSLREKYDYILVGKGENADVQIDIRSAELLAKKILELNVSAIIDLYELKQHERILFVKRFLEAMINAKKELWHPCLVIVDEAHQFCPEGKSGKAESTPAVIDLMTRGRKRGYVGVLATQRISKLNKDAAAEANNKLIGRAALDIDMKRAGEELGFSSKEDFKSLRQLEPGEFLTFGPAFTPTVTKVKINKVETTHPDQNQRIGFKTSPPTPKIKALLAKLVDLPQKAQDELHEISDYQAKIRSLEAQLRAAHQNTHSNLTNELKKEIKKQKETISFYENQYIQTARWLKEKSTVLQKIRDLTESMVFKPSNPCQSITKKEIESRPKPIIKEKPKYVEPNHFNTNEGALRTGAMKMLKAVAMFHPRPISRLQMATLAGFSVKGGTFNTYISELKRNQWIQESGDQINITEEGLENSGNVPPLPTNSDQIIDMWAAKFRTGAAKILRFIAEKYPESTSEDEIGEATGFSPSGGTFNTYISELKRNKLIEKNSNGELQATKELFLED